MRITSGRFGVLAVAALAVSLAMGPGLALGDGGGGGGGDEEKRAGVPEDRDYAAGVRAIKAGNYAAGIASLNLVVARDDRNADALNWLAYATRKAGDPAKSIPLYERALAIDPKHRGAHEYIGEAYLALDDVAKARQHLARLDSLCFFSCEEYRDLKKAILEYEAKRGGAKPARR
jgi:tetratricopeptide (TPR) repeat protein